jgi:tripartite-type tricarboxylate transporter receptor subunit TctC
MMNQLAPIAAAVALLAAAPAYAQSAADYPNKPVRVVVTVPAGGGVDTVTRIVTERMRTVLGQPFVVENKGGAGGNIAADFVFQSAPDGYTLMASQPAPLTTNVVLYKHLGFDPTAFAPIALMSSAPNVLLVKGEFPAKTGQEFMAYVKANPGKLNYASQGPGTTSHLTAELFNKLTGAKLQHVPYKGTGPALNDLVAGHVDLIFMQFEAAVKLHEGGKARILAVTTEKRIASLPNIPTMIELGLKDFVSDTWNAITAPPKTPAPIVAKLNTAVNDVLKMPEIQDQYRKLGLQIGGGTPQDMAKVMKGDTERWGAVIKEANIPQL